MAAQPTLLSHDPRDELASADSPARLDLSSLRLLRVPEVAPPFDGEILPADGTPQPVDKLGFTPAAAEIPRDGAGAYLRAPLPGWAEPFASLLVESLAGARPQQQLLPWLTGRARVHLRRVAPVLRCGQRPRVLRVLASQPTESAVEMSVIVGLGTRTRALAVRLEAAHPEDGARAARWLCTDIEAA